MSLQRLYQFQRGLNEIDMGMKHSMEIQQIKLFGHFSNGFKSCLKKNNFWHLYWILLQNKKQRKMVRETVLKLKDPKMILEEMFKIDLMGKFSILLC